MKNNLKIDCFLNIIGINYLIINMYEYTSKRLKND